MQVNSRTQRNPVLTHEGGRAVRIGPYEQLRRSVLSCLLWEREFYEDGQDIAARILETAAHCRPEQVAALAIEARTVHGIRHASLLLTLDLVGRGGPLAGETVEAVVSRADELSELVAMYWQRCGGRKMLSAQLKKGLAAAFGKFDAYQLAKYNRDRDVRLADVLALVHPRTEDPERWAVYQQLAEGTLPSPDTWEVALSGGANKREVFERLLAEGKLGYLALLRNLRGMLDAGVHRDMIADAIAARRGDRYVLPHRYVAAARAAPSLEPYIDAALLAKLSQERPLSGLTVVLVDVSGSMNAKLSAKSDLTRMDAAAALSAIVVSEKTRVFSFSDALVECPPRRGMAGIDVVVRSQRHSGTRLGLALESINREILGDYRLIVITDEQSQDRVPAPVADRAYLINVASARNGVGYRNGWTHLDGFSEATLRWIAASEARPA